MSDSERILFAGTPTFAATILESLLANEQNRPLAVYTQPDRRAGRGKRLQASPVKELALAEGIAVEQPVNFREEADCQRLAAYRPDLLVVAAYGLILPQRILDVPRSGCINVHASLLPRWRGAAPVERAIEAGDETTGVTIMRMDAGLDTGDMLLKRSLDIRADDTGDLLRERLAELGAEALAETLELWRRGTLSPVPQPPEGASYANKLLREEAVVDWRLGAETLQRRIRAFVSANVCFGLLQGQRVRIWDAAAERGAAAGEAGQLLSADASGVRVQCGEGVLRLLVLQLPGGKKLPVRELLNSQAHRLLLQPGRQFDRE